MVDFAAGGVTTRVFAGSITRRRLAHGILMLLGWGVFAPIGIAAGAQLKFEDPLWFGIHRGCMVLSLTLATAGFVVALVSFGATGVDSLLGKHRIVGIFVMSGGLFQPLNAVLRPPVTVFV